MRIWKNTHTHKQVAKAFGTLKSQGKVSHFGVSNFTASQVRLLQSRLSFPLVTNQIEFHPLALEPLDSGVLDQAQELRMAPMIWSPLAGGRLVNPSLAMKDDRAKRVQDTLKSLAVKYGPSVTQDQVLPLFFVLSLRDWMLSFMTRRLCTHGSSLIPRDPSSFWELIKLSVWRLQLGH